MTQITDTLTLNIPHLQVGQRNPSLWRAFLVAEKCQQKSEADARAARQRLLDRQGRVAADEEEVVRAKRHCRTNRLAAAVQDWSRRRGRRRPGR